MSSASASPWEEFTQDPRRAESGPMRASDQDRAVVLGVLGEGYAEGRLDREEYDERAACTTAAKTLGELAPMIADLVPPAPRPPAGRDAAAAAQADLRRLAVRHWQSMRQRALTVMLVASLVCWLIWVPNGWVSGTFPWPVFVSLGTGAQLLRVLLNRQDIIDDELRRLERRQRAAFEIRTRLDRRDRP